MHRMFKIHNCSYVLTLFYAEVLQSNMVQLCLIRFHGDSEDD